MQNIEKHIMKYFSTNYLKFPFSFIDIEKLFFHWEERKGKLHNIIFYKNKTSSCRENWNLTVKKNTISKSQVSANKVIQQQTELQ